MLALRESMPPNFSCHLPLDAFLTQLALILMVANRQARQISPELLSAISTFRCITMDLLQCWRGTSRSHSRTDQLAVIFGQKSPACERPCKLIGGGSHCSTLVQALPLSPSGPSIRDWA